MRPSFPLAILFFEAHLRHDAAGTGGVRKTPYGTSGAFNKGGSQDLHAPRRGAAQADCGFGAEYSLGGLLDSLSY